MGTVKRIHVVLEAMDYNYIMDVQPPNIMRYDVHPAVTWGVGSRPSAAAYLGGMLPICQIPECYHRQIEINWCNPFFLTVLKQKVDKLFLLTSNGWTLELMLPWIDKEQKKLNLKWVEFRSEELPAREMINYFLQEKDKYDSYYAYIHLFETHWPFHAPGLPRNGKHRKEALLYVDEQLGSLFDECDKEAKIVISSDHNLPPKEVSAAFDVPSPRTLLSFIATNFTHIEKLYPGDHLEFAKKIWLGDKV